MSSSADDDQLIAMVRARAQNPATRTDYRSVRHDTLPAPVTPEMILEAEERMGCALHPLHRRLLQEVGNGGFGPGDGLVGLGPGGLDAHGRSLVELRDILWLDAETPLPSTVVPLCDWGDGIWSCLDMLTDTVLTLDESGLTDTKKGLRTWLSAWIDGANLFEEMFVFEESTMINPFTKQVITVGRPARAVGTPYVHAKPAKPQRGEAG